MLARNETIFKWALYAAATLLALIAQSVLFQRLTLWGVIPFIYPLLAAIPSTFEAPVPATIFALCTGVCCDALLPAPIPCFYTMIFPLVGLAASLLSRSLLPAGYLCSLTAAAAAFLMVGLFHCLLLWIMEKAAWGSGLLLMLKELLVSLPLCFPLTWLYRAVFLRTHLDD